MEAEVIEVKTAERAARPEIPTYAGIPIIDPLVQRAVLGTTYPPDIKITPSQLPKAQAILKDYFHQITFHLNRNEENIAFHIRRQMEEYSKLNVMLQKRGVEMDAKLSKMLGLFKSLNDDVKATTDSLDAVIARAEKIAKSLDPDLPDFNTFKSQH